MLEDPWLVILGAWGMSSGRGSNKNLLRFVFAESKVVATHFDFNRIAHGSEPNQLDARANQEAHFHKAWAAFRGEFDFRHRDSGPQRDGSQRL